MDEFVGYIWRKHENVYQTSTNTIDWLDTKYLIVIGSLVIGTFKLFKCTSNFSTASGIDNQKSNNYRFENICKV